MFVTLVYNKNKILNPTDIGPATNIFVTHEFVLGRGISCAQIYDDIYTGLKYNGNSGPIFSGDIARNKLIDPTYDALLPVLVVLKKTLCDWLQNFLKLGVRTKIHNELGFSIEIQPKIDIRGDLLSYPTDKTVDFSKTGISYNTPITGIDRVLMALERSELFEDNPVHYICIRPEANIGSTDTFLFVPYSPTTKLFKFKVNSNPFILINEKPYIPIQNEDTGLYCYVPRFHLFNYINIFWDKYRSVYSPEHYRAISTLPSLSPIEEWKPDFCITGDILDLWISFTLTKITFWPLPPEMGANQLEYVKNRITPTENIVITDDIFTELNSRVKLTNTILTITGGSTKINHNNRRKRRVSYSNTKRKSRRRVTKKKTKKIRKTKRNQQNKMKSTRKNKNITINNNKQ
jgi:hypothetical protein